MQPMQNLSTLLISTTGAEDATNRLFELLYGELRSIASLQLHLNDHKGMLNTTTLVHEAYLRFLKSGEIKPEDRGHFLAYASHVMRSIVVDMARWYMANKRGNGQANLKLNTDIGNGMMTSNEQIIQLHDALDELAALEPRLAKVVEMRYFGGLQEQEVADALSVSLRTVQRDWEKARMILSAALKK
ncbi:MAG: ECF-type sigma factor [Steroidobacter sp.]